MPRQGALQLDGSTALAAPTRLVEARLTQVLDEMTSRWTRRQPGLGELFDELSAFIAAGGKRLRPLFCFWGAVGAGASEDAPDVVDLGAALELLHAFALIHDDVMDGSDTRRGRPSMHRRFEYRHAAERLGGERRRFGEGLAVLAGDLAFVLADTLVGRLPIEVRTMWDELRIELTMGQWLDMVGAARRDRSPEVARWVATYKSGRYTVERPLQLGAALAGRNELIGQYATVGRPLGEAFQLRDDLLGVFGDPRQTGKPVGADLREGKPTLLLALAVAGSDASRRCRLGRAGAVDLTDDEVGEMVEVVRTSGAVETIERQIGDLVEQALDALDHCRIEPSAAGALRSLCGVAAWRQQ
jgi:geranylgeranyl diphosphate synthase, type I